MGQSLRHGQKVSQDQRIGRGASEAQTFISSRVSRGRCERLGFRRKQCRGAVFSAFEAKSLLLQMVT